MLEVIIDIETEEIPKQGWTGVDTIHCIVTKEVGKEPEVWTEASFPIFLEYAKKVDTWIAHNGVAFDIPVVNRVLKAGIDETKVIDTFIVSRLVNYSRYRTHSLEELGLALGYPKGDFHDWTQLTQEMINYCIRDCEVTERIYKMYHKYIWDDTWKDALRLEHDMALINNEMSLNGFKFDVDNAAKYLGEITSRMAVLEAEFQKLWPPELQPVGEVQYRVKADGTLYATVTGCMDRYPKTEKVGNKLVCYDWVSFNPGSTKDRIDKLWKAGWNPTFKTKTHMKFDREGRVGEFWGKSVLTQEKYDEKKAHFAHYGWTVNEENLLTLPESAPEGAKRLSEWLTLEGRRSSLAEWLGCVSEDGRIRGKFWHIGAWTHRMSHSAPNQANIFSPFHGEPRNAVEQVKAEYDYKLRALWCTDKILVGTDAAGIQLRILTHYMKSPDYRDSIVSGKKEDLTDIHNLNKKALGPVCRDRDTAKTYIYAWLLGAGTNKIASILSTNNKKAKEAVANFLESLPELKKLKTGKIPFDAARGYFDGLDGRKVLCDSEHLMLAGYLQNGEAIVMKMWIREWKRLAGEAGLWYKLVDFVHDECQTEVNTMEDAEKLKTFQAQAMNTVAEELDLYCPLEVESQVGSNWAETH